MDPCISCGSAVKNPPSVQETQETWVRSLGWEDPLEKEMATHSSMLAWKIPWTEEPGGLQSMASRRVWHKRACTHGYIPIPQHHQISCKTCHSCFLYTSFPTPLRHSTMIIFYGSFFLWGKIYKHWNTENLCFTLLTTGYTQGTHIPITIWNTPAFPGSSFDLPLP